MDISKNNLAKAFALSAGVLWVLCSAFVAIFPDFSYKVTKWWMHGMNIDALGKFHLGWSNFLLGGITLILSSWLVGYVLGWSLGIFSIQKTRANKTSKKERAS